MTNPKALLYIAATSLLLVGFVILALSLGNIHIPFVRVLEVLSAPDLSSESFVISEVRLPRVLGAVCIGASLALSGALYQGVIGNPLVSPGILGVLNGASFGAALGMILGLNLIGLELVCFVCGLLAMCVALGLSYAFDRYQSVLMLILGGVISSAFFGAGVSVLKLLADPYNTLPNIVFWLMGSLAYIQMPPLGILGALLALSLLASLYFSRHIDILNLDDESASSLGVNVKAVRLLFVLIATLFGALFLLLCDTLSRCVADTEIPIGILTSLFGIPIFACVLIITKKREH